MRSTKFTESIATQSAPLLVIGSQPPLSRAFPRFLSYGWSLVPIRRGEKAPDLDLLRDMYGDTRIAHLRYAPALAGEVELWFENEPEINLAVIPGEPSRLVVADVDLWGAKISVLPANPRFLPVRTEFWHPTGLPGRVATGMPENFGRVRTLVTSRARFLLCAHGVPGPQPGLRDGHRCALCQEVALGIRAPTGATTNRSVPRVSSQGSTAPPNTRACV